MKKLTDQKILNITEDLTLKWRTAFTFNDQRKFNVQKPFYVFVMSIANLKIETGNILSSSWLSNLKNHSEL